MCIFRKYAHLGFSIQHLFFSFLMLYAKISIQMDNGWNRASDSRTDITYTALVAFYWFPHNLFVILCRAYVWELCLELLKTRHLKCFVVSFIALILQNFLMRFNLCFKPAVHCLIFFSPHSHGTCWNLIYLIGKSI